MARRYKNFRDGKSRPPPDEWGDINEDRLRERHKKSDKRERRNTRESRRDDTFVSYKDWRDR